jgi:hypothetical protein
VHNGSLKAFSSELATSLEFTSAPLPRQSFLEMLDEIGLSVLERNIGNSSTTEGA